MKGENIMKKLAILLIGILLVFVSCKKKDLDKPEITSFPETNVWTVGQILDTLTLGTFQFDKDWHKDAIVKGYVIADETGGNIYRTFYLRGTDGRCIAVYRKGSGDGGSESFNVKTGDYIGYKLYGSIISEYSRLPQIQVQEYDPNKLIVIYERGCNDKVQPISTTIEDINASKHLCDLVKLSDVQFESYEGLTYAEGQTNTNRSLVSCSGEAIIVRTSGYASFAAEPLPEGKGTLTSIVSLYNTTWQLLLRNTTDVHLNGQRCGEGGDIMDLPYVQNFSSSFGTYTTFDVEGPQTWVIDYQTAKMTGKEGSTFYVNEDWLISSPVNIANVEHARAVVNYVAQYNGPANDVTIQISADYEYGEDPQDYTWTQLNAEFPNTSGWQDFQNVEINLDEYIGQTLTFAVKFISTDSQSRTIEVKSIAIEDGTPEPPAQTIFSESFATSQGDFSIYNAIMPSNLTYVWKYDSQYSCMKASAYAGGALEAESWLISPEISLDGYSSAVLSFEHAFKYGSDPQVEMTLWITNNYDPQNPSANWNPVSIPNYPTGQNWNFYESGDINIASYLGQNVRIAFRYKSTAAAAPTWEVKNVVIKE